MPDVWSIDRTTAMASTRDINFVDYRPQATAVKRSLARLYGEKTKYVSDPLTMIDVAAHS
jgi:hypothetical protein